MIGFALFHVLFLALIGSAMYFRKRFLFVPLLFALGGLSIFLYSFFVADHFLNRLIVQMMSTLGPSLALLWEPEIIKEIVSRVYHIQPRGEVPIGGWLVNLFRKPVACFVTSRLPWLLFIVLTLFMMSRLIEFARSVDRSSASQIDFLRDVFSQPPIGPIETE